MAGLALQNRLPNARILYVLGHRGPPTPPEKSWPTRPDLGLWGGPEAPSRPATLSWTPSKPAAWRLMELIARELKAMGLYIARSLFVRWRRIRGAASSAYGR